MAERTEVTETAESLDSGGYPSQAAPRASAAGPGETIDRYVVLDFIGAGGMGAVYTAYDPELDRRVALKVLQPTLSDRSPRASARLLREAQALARCTHPNIVAIHDVGTHGGDVFLAMEFVEGETLGDWVSNHNPGLERLLEVFVQAGRGLAAAHEAGVVHRDFKPGNVMIGSDGRARVLDFGLARATDASSTADSLPADASKLEPGASPLDTPLTRTGSVMGTPAYMSPEQHLGGTTDARTDQFSFCVTLWEAIYGRRPFGGSTPAALAAAVLEGKRDPPPQRAVPSSVVRVLERGLSVEPGQRFADMNELLARLERRGSGFMRWLVPLALIGVGTAGAVGYSMATPEVAACVGAEQHLAGIWNPDQADAIRGAFEASGSANAGATFERVSTRLDDYAEAWVGSHIDACTASVRKEQSAAMLDRRMACLAERRTALEATVGVLSSADADLVGRAVDLVAGLPPVARCDDVTALSHAIDPPTDPATIAIVDEQTKKLAEVAALDRAARIDVGLDMARDVVEVAEELDYPPLLARSLVALGNLQRLAADHDAASHSLERGYFIAREVGDEREAFRAALRLTLTVASRATDLDEGEAWAEHARVALVRSGGGSAEESALLAARGDVEHAQGKYPTAIETYQLAMETRLLDPARALDPGTAGIWTDLAKSYQANAQPVEAERASRRQLEILEQVYGPDHPEIGDALHALANSTEQLGRLDEAVEIYQRAIDLRAATLGPDHLLIAQTRADLAGLHHRARREDEAIAEVTRALATFEQQLGPDHPYVGVGLLTLGDAHVGKKQYAEGIGHYRRAVAVLEKALGPDHPHTGAGINNLAAALRRSGNLDEAATMYARAHSIFETALGSKHPYVGATLHNIGLIQRDRRQHAEAVETLSQALEIREAAQSDGSDVAETQFELARALADLGQDPARASELAGTARAAYAALGEKWEDELATIDEWIAAHPPP